VCESYTGWMRSYGCSAVRLVSRHSIHWFQGAQRRTLRVDMFQRRMDIRWSSPVS
jgi:hypothetical protein